MKNSHGTQHEEGVHESCHTAGDTSKDQDKTKEEFSVNVITNLTGNETEERVGNGVNKSDEQTIPVLKLRISCSDFIHWIVPIFTEAGVTISIVKTLSLPLDHDTGTQGNE